jgi:glutamine synthetase
MAAVMFSGSEALPMIVPAESRNAEGLRTLLAAHPNIRFVSLAGVDLGGNETDERIPASTFLADAQTLLTGGVQTDGSSVVLPGIATLNDGKVDLIADSKARWIIDYNESLTDAATGLPVGAVRIPAFLEHAGQRVDSRSALARAEASAQKRLLALLKQHPEAARGLGLEPGQIAEIVLTSATELEFWVRTPGAREEVEQLAVSQALQEQYWKPTRGAVRTGLERSLALLEAYGLRPEMGHKEVGGVDARIVGRHGLAVMEQIEIDWRFATALEAADNELLARTLIAQAFRAEGLEVTFSAKPIEGVAGSGEHTHVGIAARLADGSLKNLFTAAEQQRDYLSPIGWGALMGLLRHWEIVGPFVTCSTDAFNRLKPGFEAPVCIVAAVGHTVEEPSRNRSVLAGLVRDKENPMATRFEVRAPNPHTNTYLALAAMYQAMLDGIAHAVSSGVSAKQLEQYISKQPGESVPYLEASRAYRSEADVFEHYTQQQRDALFGTPPATVGATLEKLEGDAGSLSVLLEDGVFDARLIASYRAAMRSRWLLELRERLLPANRTIVRECRRIHGPDEDAPVERLWEKVQKLRRRLLRGDQDEPALFQRVQDAVDEGADSLVSALQQEMAETVTELRQRYARYTASVLDPIQPDDDAQPSHLFSAAAANASES